MRYRIRVLRAQKADRIVNADVEVLAQESSLPSAPHPLGESSLMLSLKDAAAHLGISRSAMYELVNRGEIEHIRVGSRMYIARSALLQFIETNSHRGYWRP